MAGKVQITIEADSERAARRIAGFTRSVGGDLKSLERRGGTLGDRMRDSFRRIGDAGRRMANQLKAAFGAIAIGGGALVAIGAKTLEATSKVTGLAEAWERTAERVGVSARGVVAEVARATQQTVARTDIEQFAARAFSQIEGLTSKQAALLARFAQEQQRILGGTFEEISGRLATGLGRASFQLLDDFGIMVQGIEGDSAVLEAAFGQIEQRVAQIGDTSDTTAGKVGAMKAAVKNLQTDFLTALSQSQAFEDALAALAGAAGETGVNVQLLGKQIDLFAAHAKIAINVLRILGAAVVGVVSGLGSLALVIPSAVLPGLALLAKAIRRMVVDTIGNAIQAMATIADVLPGGDETAAQLAGAARAVRNFGRSTTDAIQSFSDSSTQAMRGLAEFSVDAFADIGDSVGRIGDAAGEVKALEVEIEQLEHAARHGALSMADLASSSDRAIESGRRMVDSITSQVRELFGGGRAAGQGALSFLGGALSGAAEFASGAVADTIDQANADAAARRHMEARKQVAAEDERLAQIMMGSLREVVQADGSVTTERVENHRMLTREVEHGARLFESAESAKRRAIESTTEAIRGQASAIQAARETGAGRSSFQTAPFQPIRNPIERARQRSQFARSVPGSFAPTAQSLRHETNMHQTISPTIIVQGPLDRQSANRFADQISGRVAQNLSRRQF